MDGSILSGKKDREGILMVENYYLCCKYVTQCDENDRNANLMEDKLGPVG